MVRQHCLMCLVCLCGVVQLAEQWPLKPRFEGSSPSTAAITRDGRVWLITVVSKTSVGKTTAGSNPALSAILY